jgi:hypothetical protein
MRSTCLGKHVISYVAIVTSSILFAALAATATPSDTPVFLAPVAYSSGGKVPLSVAVVDLNHDGKPDLALANYCSGSSSCTSLTPGEVAVRISKRGALLPSCERNVTFWLRETRIRQAQSG